MASPRSASGGRDTSREQRTNEAMADATRFSGQDGAPRPLLSMLAANLLNQVNRVGGTEVSRFDPQMTYGQAAKGAGYDNEIIQLLFDLAGGFVEPGPGEVQTLGSILRRSVPLMAAAMAPRGFRGILKALTGRGDFSPTELRGLSDEIAAAVDAHGMDEARDALGQLFYDASPEDVDTLLSRGLQHNDAVYRTRAPEPLEPGLGLADLAPQEAARSAVGHASPLESAPSRPADLPSNRYPLTELGNQPAVPTRAALTDVASQGGPGAITEWLTALGVDPAQAEIVEAAVGTAARAGSETGDSYLRNALRAAYESSPTIAADPGLASSMLDMFEPTGLTSPLPTPDPRLYRERELQKLKPVTEERLRVLDAIWRNLNRASGGR